MNLLEHKLGRGLMAFAFYFAEGAPIGFIWWAIPTLLRQKGVEIDTVTAFTAMFTIPWIFKFLWAPLIDIFRSPNFGYTKWIGWSQALMCLSLLPLVFIPIAGNVVWWGIFLLLHSLFAATQDVSVDALIINVVEKEGKGMLNGYMQAGMLLGRSIFGGAALVFIPKIGLPVTIVFMVTCIFFIMLLLFFIKEPSTTFDNSLRFRKFKNRLTETFHQKQTWYTIAFALTSAAALETAGGMCGSFLTDKQVDMESIGFFFGIPVVLAMLLGGFTGGFLSDKMRRKRAITIYIIGFVLLISAIAALDLTESDASHFTWMVLFTGMYFFTGMFTAASYALFMDVTNPKLGATEFSTFMAAVNGCEAWVLWSAGITAASYNYSVAFLVMCLVSLFSMFFLRKIND